MENPLDRYNMKFYYSDDLREVPEDPEQMRRGTEEIRKMLERETEELKKAALKSQIGSYARIMGDLDLAEKMLDEALEIVEKEGKVHHALAIKLRLAIVYQWREEYSKADNIYSKSIKLMRSSKDENVQKYLDFALQHYAKMHFDQGQYQGAVDLFIEALELRLEKGDMSLVESTQKAIEICRSKVEEAEES